MQDFLNSNTKSELDLREFFITLWAYKLLIAFTCALGVVFGGYYALNADKKFTSTAIFKLGAKKSGGISLSSQLSTISTLAGLNNNFSINTLPKDQANGRVFIEKLDAKLNFQEDPYFNTYNPNSVSPIWKSLIKRAIGSHKSKNVEEAIWQGIVKSYSENVELDKTLNGSIKVVATHVKPQRAAEVANTVMNEIIASQKLKANKEQDQQLSYLSNTLATALSELEISQSNLKIFALENSALPLENFTAGSLQLDALREQLNQASELHGAMAALFLMLKNETTAQKNYQELQKKFPIIDQVDFRRVLGQNEIISSWNWPKINTVAAVLDTLNERKNRLQFEINESQIDAERSSQALETYAKLEREAKISEATYTVLIEQVKSQSMVAGFRPDMTEIYEYASPPINPSAPKSTLILALGALLGLLVGTGLSIVIALRRDICYSINTLKDGIQARLIASIKTLKPMRKKSLDDINTMLMKKPYPVLRDMAVEIHKSKSNQVVVTSSRAKLTGNDVARALASYMQSDDLKIAVIDFSSNRRNQGIDTERLAIGSFVVSENTGNVSALRPNNDLVTIEMLSQRDFSKNLQSLNSTIDLLFLCADDGDAISLLRALQGQKIFHVTLARIKHTKSANLALMRSILPIQGLLYG